MFLREEHVPFYYWLYPPNFMKFYHVLRALILLFCVSACTASTPPSVVVVTPTSLAATSTAESITQPTSPPASPTVIPTTIPTETSSPPPVATPKPGPLLAAANAGMARVRAQAGDATLVCLRYEDTDADGAPEWFALTHQATVSPTRLSAFVLDETEAYPLEPAYPKPGAPDIGLGQYTVCDVEIRDLNADGRTEIAIFGHGAGNETLLHLYAWDGEHYQRLGRFAGDAGVLLKDVDGDLAVEIWEGYRVAGTDDFAWYAIHTWTGQSYGWTSDRYDWFYLTRPHSYRSDKPDFAVISFYLALDDRDLPGAYALLTPADDRPYAAWALGYATTLRVDAGNVHTIPGTVSDTSARVATMITAWDNEGGGVVRRLWNVEWQLARTAEGWRLVAATSELLEEGPVSYWK